jgi:serine/threonine-protein phosphatase 2A regulatory subunit A
LARQLGESFFNERLNPISVSWLQDSIFTIREAAIENFKELSKIFGAQWASRFAVPRLIALHTDSNYLHRQTPLFGISALAQIVTIDTIRR